SSGWGDMSMWRRRRPERGRAGATALSSRGPSGGSGGSSAGASPRSLVLMGSPGRRRAVGGRNCTPHGGARPPKKITAGGSGLPRLPLPPTASSEGPAQPQRSGEELEAHARARRGLDLGLGRGAHPQEEARDG